MKKKHQKKAAISILLLCVLCAAFTLRNNNWFLIFALVLCIISRGSVFLISIRNISFPMMLILCLGIYAVFVTLIFRDGEGIIKLLYQIFWVLAVIIAYPTNKQEQILLMHLLKFFLLFICILGLYEYYGGVDFWSLIGMSRNFNGRAFIFNRITSMFYNPLIYGIYLQMALVLEIQFPFKNTLVNIAATALIVMNLVFTFSRSVWVVTLIVVIINYLIGLDRKRKMLINEFLITLIILCLLVVFLYYIRDIIKELTSLIVKRFSMFGKTDYSYTQRYGAIINILNYLVRHPIQLLVGSGRGYAQQFMQEYFIYRGFDAVDNQYFAFVLEFGLIGITMFVTAIVLLIKRIISHLKKKENNNTILKAALMMLCCFSIDIFFYDGMSWYTVLFIFALLLCMSKTTYRQLEEE